MKQIKKKGVTPVIATIMLIAIVVILALIIFLWARGFVAEKAQKFDRAVEFSCPDVELETGIFFDVDQEKYFLDVINRGNVPVYGFVIKRLGEGEVIIAEDTSSGTIKIGQSMSIPLSAEVASGQDLLVIPKILGETGSGNTIHICADNDGQRTTVP